MSKLNPIFLLSPTILSLHRPHHLPLASVGISPLLMVPSSAVNSAKALVVSKGPTRYTILSQRIHSNPHHLPKLRNNPSLIMPTNRKILLTRMNILDSSSSNIRTPPLLRPRGHRAMGMVALPSTTFSAHYLPSN